MFPDSCRKEFKLIFSCLLFFNASLLAQRVLEVKYEQDSKGSYTFSCFNNAYCNYILELGFTSLNNLKCDQSLPFHAEVKPGYNKLFTISAVDTQAPVQFKYTSTYQKGCIHPELNPDFIYLFPIKPGTSAQVFEMSPDKSTDSSSWYVLRLKMKPGDTIYASRKGLVNIVHVQNGANDSGRVSIGTENFIEIAHADCSFARYGILRKNSAFVKQGELVKAGQAIGLVGGDTYGRGSDLRMSVYYYREDNGKLSQSAVSHYVIMQIWTKQNGKGRLRHGAIYTSEFPDGIIKQETPDKTAAPKKKRKA
jgi:hypothetical protein